jgi:hypothetical protein
VARIEHAQGVVVQMGGEVGDVGDMGVGAHDDMNYKSE